MMKGGEVVETGSHDELMASKGHYYEMVALQGSEDIIEKEGTMIYLYLGLLTTVWVAVSVFSLTSEMQCSLRVYCIAIRPL